MSDANDWQAFGRASWGPVRVSRRGDAVVATVGRATVQIDLTDPRPASERQREPWRSPFDAGVPVVVDGTRAGTITRPSGAAGLVRRRRHDVAGDGALALPGLRFTDRGLPTLLTLRSDRGVLVTSRRWAAPLNMLVTEFSFVREHDLVPPRVSSDATDEHVALWFAMRECL
ncbi:hypothetical protein [Aeromicrobium sp. 179-A 4D2 NHS]|uniref:hypothetical protein n=1 Tax=Aeromicrobium sp. 179-A 4D2 NHS TaxID=3142375 RepID=UPI00399F8175